MEFRKQALSKLQSPEELDLPVRFARPQGWLVLAVTVIVMAVGTVWSVAGRVSSTLRAVAILTHAQGSYILQSPVAGQVTDVLATAGKRLPANAPLFKVHTAKGERLIRTIAAGRVTTLAVTIGAVVRTGADVATMERIDRPGAPLMAVAYVPEGSAGEIPAGATVDLTLQSVSTRRYGTLRGHVRSIGQAPQTRQQISAFLGDEQLGDDLTRQGRPVAVLIRLDPAPGDTSGYRWSSSQGPPVTLDSMTGASASIRLAEQRPADWLLP